MKTHRLHRLAILVLAAVGLWITPLFAQEDLPTDPAERIELANDRFESGDRDGALELVDQLADELTAADLDSARLLLRVGSLYKDLKKNDAARVVLETVLLVFEEELGTEHVEVGDACLHLGSVLQDLGEGEAGIANLQRARQIYTINLGPADDKVADATATLGFSLIWEERIDEAEAILVETRDALVAKDPDAKKLPHLVNLLAQIDDTRGNYGPARDLYQEALAGFVKHEGADSRGVAIVYYRLGRIAYILGDNDQAIEDYTNAAETMGKVEGKESPLYGALLSERAAPLSDAERFDEAFDVLMKAKVVMEAGYEAGHPNLAGLYHRLGETEQRRENYREAIPWFEQAVEIRTAVYGEENGVTTSSMYKIASCYKHLGEPTKATPLLHKVLAAREKRLGKEHHFTGAALEEVAINHADLGEYTQALTKSLESERILRNQHRKSMRSLSERSGLLYASDRNPTAPINLSLGLAQHLGGRAEIRQTWDALVHARGMVLDELARRRHALRELNSEEVSTRWMAWTDASSEVARLSAEATSESPELEAARDAQDEAELALANVSRSFSRQRSVDAMNLQQVEDALPAGTALVAYERYNDYFTREISYLAMVRTTAGDLHCVRVGSSEEIDSAIQAWRQEAGRGALGSHDDPVAKYREVASVLRALVWDPIQPLIADAKMALVVPAANLGLVSFPSLPVGEDQYLVESDPTIHVVGTERDIPEFLQSLDRQGSLIAFGDPAFDASATQVAGGGGGGTGGLGEAAAYRGVRNNCASFQSVQFERLPGSRDEVADVAARWGDKAIALTDEAANETSFKELAPQARVLHLATHGFFVQSDCVVLTEAGISTDDRGVGGLAPQEEEQSPLSLSGIALAGANLRHQAAADAEDGILTADEVATLDLSGLEWAVLSACDSGVGEVLPGEGVFGLRRAFRAAGARTIIMSLWSVADRDAKAWMAALYEARLGDGASTAEAVRTAATSVLRARRDAGESTHPFHWAGFVASGDWQ